MPNRRAFLTRIATYFGAGTSSARTAAAQTRDCDPTAGTLWRRYALGLRRRLIEIRPGHIQPATELSFCVSRLPSSGIPQEHPAGTALDSNELSRACPYHPEKVILRREPIGLLNFNSAGYNLDYSTDAMPSAKLLIYCAGTDNLCPVYKDSNLTVTQSNPVRLDGSGQFPQCFLIDGAYRFIIQDMHDNIVYEVDNLRAGTSSELSLLLGYRSSSEVAADVALSYQDSAGQSKLAHGTLRITVGEVLNAADYSFRYSVAPPDATDHHLATQGGVKLYVRPVNGEVPIEAFGGEYDVALGLAIEVASHENARVVHVPGRTYTSSGGTTVVDRNVSIDFRGAMITRHDVNTPLLNIAYSYQYVTRIADISVTDIDFGGGGARCQRIAVAPGSAILGTLAAGDVVKIVSDQKIPSSPADDDERLGESMEVAAIDAGTGHIDLVGLLRESFIVPGNNVRIARATRKSCLIRGLHASSTDLSEPLVRVTGAVRPVVEMAAEMAHSPALELQSCYRSHVTLAAHGLLTDDTRNMYGYGVVSYGGKNGRYDVTAQRVRHAWTSGARAVTGLNSPDIHRYGGSIDEHVIVDAADCYGAGFDTHSDALGTVARGVVRNTFPGDNTSNTCVQLRGRQCDVDITTIGVSAAKVQIRGTGGDHRIRVNHRRPHDFGTTLPIVDIEGDPVNHRNELWLDLTNTSSQGQFPLIKASNCKLHTSRLMTRDTRSGPGSIRPSVVDAENAVVDVRNFLVDWHSADGSLTPALARLDSNSTVSFAGGTMRRSTAAYFLADLRNGSGSFQLNGLECDQLPDEPVNPGAANWMARDISVNQLTLAQIHTQNGNSNGTVSPLEGQVQVLATALTANCTIALPTHGLYAGMRIEFIRTAEATGDFGWTVTGGSESYTLNVNSRLSLMFDGTVWIVMRRDGFRGVRLRADQNGTMTPNTESVQIYDSVLTANRTLRLPTRPDIYHIRRTAGATGAFTVTVADSTGATIHQLSVPDSWVQVAVTGASAYVIAAK